MKTKLFWEMNFSSQRQMLPPWHNPMKTMVGNKKCCYKTTVSLMGNSVIIRCICKPGTTFPARLLSITSHCIIVPCQTCQLTHALLIKWTTQGRWRAKKQPVIFTVIVSLFGSLTWLLSFPITSFLPNTKVSLGNICGEKEAGNWGEMEKKQEQKGNIFWKPHL